MARDSGKSQPSFQDSTVFSCVPRTTSWAKFGGVPFGTLRAKRRSLCSLAGLKPGHYITAQRTSKSPPLRELMTQGWGARSRPIHQPAIIFSAGLPVLPGPVPWTGEQCSSSACR